MKINKIVQILALVAFPVIGVADNSCDDLNPISSAEDILKIATYTGCSDKKEKDQCDCIQDEIARGSNSGGSFGENNLRIQIDEAYNDIQKNIENNKKQYFDKYSSVYKILTVNAAAQRMVLDLDTEPAGVGCTAKDMSAGIKLKTEKSLNDQILALEELKSRAEEGKSSLSSNKADLLDKKIKKMQELKNSNSAAYCRMAIQALSDQHSQEIIDQRNHLNSQKKLQMDGISESECPKVLKTYTEILEAEENKMGGGLAISTDKKNDCLDNDPLCAAFAIKNKELNIEANNLYGEQDGCISFAEYTAFKSKPDDELLRKFSKMKHPEKLLDPTYTGIWSQGNDAQKRKFLQSNPLIAQLATSADKNIVKELANRLQKMAKKMTRKGITEAEKFKIYMSFMKGGENGDEGLKGLYKESGADVAMAACGNLQSSFTAIALANDNDEASTEKLMNQNKVVFSCVAKLYEGTSSSNLDKTLNESKVYQMSPDDDSGLPSLENYKGFLTKECANIEKIRDLKTTFRDVGFKSKPTENDLKKMSTWNKESMQNHEYKNEYHREVTSKMNHNALATVFDRGEFKKAQRQNEIIQSSQNIGANYSARQQGTFNNGIAQNNSFSALEGFESRKNSSQVRPVFEEHKPQMPAPVTNFESFVPKKMQEAQSITDLDPSFNQRPYEEKLSTYKALNDYVSKGGASPKFSPSEKIKELEKSLEKSKISLKELEKKEDQKGPEISRNPISAVSRNPANFKQASFVAPIPNAPVLGQFPGSRVVVGSDAKISKAEASYQAALMQKYEMNQNLQIVIQGQDALVKAPYKIKASNIVKTDDVYTFDKLSDPNKLSEFIAVKIGDNIADGESIKIIDPVSNNYFLLKATVKDGVTSYQRYPFVDEKDIRIVKLGDLYNTLKFKR